MKGQTTRRILISILCINALSGCADPTRKLTYEIVRTPPEQRATALSRLPAERQLDVYEYAYRRMEPSVILAGEVASNWRTTLPVITDRLARNNSEQSLVGLMMILSTVSSQNCSLAKRNDTLLAASQAVSKISPPYRELAERQLKKIKNPDSDLPPCE
jgi:hypothetical protein